MSTTDEEPTPDLDSFYDDGSEAGLTCRICGVLVARDGTYPRVHWDWHEASNGGLAPVSACRRLGDGSSRPGRRPVDAGRVASETSRADSPRREHPPTPTGRH